MSAESAKVHGKRLSCKTFLDVSRSSGFVPTRLQKGTLTFWIVTHTIQGDVREAVFHICDRVRLTKQLLRPRYDAFALEVGLNMLRRLGTGSLISFC